jgi:nicotinate-nucleotide adenylyltransferase
LTVPGRHDRERLRRPTVRINRPVPRKPAAKPTRRPRVGLFGGSFNPAHEGHRQVSLEALRDLDLDRVWWLVSPQNPLKPDDETADLRARLTHARALAGHPRIVVTDVEAQLGTRFTVDTLRRLVRRRGPRFVWIIGADNLIQMPCWRGWRDIFARLPVAVLDREPYGFRALAGRAAQVYRRARLPTERATRLVDAPPPVWTYLWVRRHPASSTALRRRGATGPGSGGGEKRR